jgi:hypothetical protein
MGCTKKQIVYIYAIINPSPAIDMLNVNNIPKGVRLLTKYTFLSNAMCIASRKCMNTVIH